MTNWPTKKLGEMIEEVFKSLALLFIHKKPESTAKVDKLEQKNPAEIKEPIVVATKSIVPEIIAEPVWQFAKGEAYLVDHSTVKKLRELIGDEFGLGKSGDCLNCTEYVQFRVKQKLSIDIKWPPDRPRNGGKWASIFEKNNLYKISDSPKVNCAVSFTTGISSNPAINEIGHVAFIEKVNDDGSIEISEANWPNQGKYNERRLEKWQWQDKYKCRFIDFV